MSRCSSDPGTNWSVTQPPTPPIAGMPRSRRVSPGRVALQIVSTWAFMSLVMRSTCWTRSVPMRWRTWWRLRAAIVTSDDLGSSTHSVDAEAIIVRIELVRFSLDLSSELLAHLLLSLAEHALREVDAHDPRAVVTVVGGHGLLSASSAVIQTSPREA